MLTTPDEPANCVKHLRSRDPSYQGVMTGHYRLWNNTVTLLVQRQDRKKIKGKKRRDYTDYCEDYSDQTFHLVIFFGNGWNHR